MGCDIHIYKEKLVDGKWQSADKWQKSKYDDEGMVIEYEERAYKGRNYELFGLLSKGVRTAHPFSLPERGLPFDVSPEVKAESDKWDGDGHSHSHITIAELKRLKDFIEVETMHIEGMFSPEQKEKLDTGIKEGNPDWGNIYPYCKWSSGGNYVNFAYDVPVKFVIGNGLETIIDSFEGIEGDDLRIVFWFDN